MGIYDKRRSVSRQELRSTFRQHHGRIPRTGGKKYYQRQREKMAGEVFGRKYGSEISKNEYRAAVRGLKSSRRTAKTYREKVKIDQKIRYLKEVGGKNI